MPSLERGGGTYSASENSVTSATVGSVLWSLCIFAITLRYKCVFHELRSVQYWKALQDLEILQYLPLRVKAIFIFVQKTTVKVSHLLTHSLHACKEHDKDWYILLAIEDCKLDILREFSWLHECFGIHEGRQDRKVNNRYKHINSRNQLYRKDRRSPERVQEFWIYRSRSINVSFRISMGRNRKYSSTALTPI